MNDLPSLEPALATMRLLASQASGTSTANQSGSGAAAVNGAGTIGGPAGGAQTGPVAAGGFAAELRHSIQRINALQIDAVDKGKAFQAGDPSVTLNDLMIDVQKASVAFEFGKQVRNRIITAYKEVMRMQV
ncbi:flagellar hook-basal body complex protein FliE [Lamprobacter modestohalophilus]|uniref:Flagellar hook-basal body complex protein FliE n=1 Tax=Lamprobacter modestohalophilus TaxID=1064514 RepID=A0A9X0W7C8_9GAMM|nr:flagellar hook-basal body complex protein FliE [Lamprobacter modestohalophilus]MBK1618353.1 flagellar hook-basal body complex protein FliE [Lamprobacter modestohalophilus]